MNCHMDAMCSARARALVQDLTSDDVENEEKYGKIGKNIGAYGESITECFKA